MRAGRSYLAADHFDLWRIPGRKHITLSDADLTLTADLSSLTLRVSLAGDVADGTAYTCDVSLTPALRGRLDALHRQTKVLQGEAPAAIPARPITRASLMHLRALQALDAAQDGASHRDIAQALFGLESVMLRWHEDGELRAQVRHILRRGEGYMKGGYLALAGVPPEAQKRPGDEALR